MYLPRRTTLGVLLAAGAGSRFTGSHHKLLAPLKGVPVVSYAVSAMKTAGVEDCIAITGSVALTGLLDDVTEVHNADWATGQRSSVLAAIDYAETHGFASIVVGLGDQPFIESDAWTAVANADSPIAIATYDGIRGNPVKLSSSVWDLFRSTPADPDVGARALIHLHPELVREVACKGNSADIDTTEDLSKWI
jgi:CTP:molybdopterin cytidylyltransferase MocA